MVAEYDAKNRLALIRLKAAGVQFHKFSDDIMDGSYKAATEMYDEEAAKNAEVQEDLRRVEEIPRRGSGSGSR